MTSTTTLFAITAQPTEEKPEQLGVRHVMIDADVQVQVEAEADRLHEQFFEGVDTHIDFTAGYKPEEDELFALSNIPMPTELATALASPASRVALTEDAVDNGDVRGLVVVRDGTPTPIVLFFSFFPMQALRKKNLNLVFSKGTFRRIENAGLVLPRTAEAVLKDSTFYFRSYKMVSRFFYLGAHFKQASNATVDEFIANSVFSCPDKAAVRSALDSVARRKIGELVRRGVLADINVADIVSAAAHHSIVMETVEEGGAMRVRLPTDKAQLKAIIKLLNEDFLDSILTSQRFVVSSKRPV